MLSDGTIQRKLASVAHCIQAAIPHQVLTHPISPVGQHSSASTRHPAHVALHKASQYTDDNNGLCQLAQELGPHPVYLACAFHGNFRCSPGDFARQHRLQRAAKLLAHSRLSLSEVAQDCAFFDQPHLNRSFRARFGVTPGEYRVRVN